MSVHYLQPSETPEKARQRLQDAITAAIPCKATQAAVMVTALMLARAERNAAKAELLHQTAAHDSDA